MCSVADGILRVVQPFLAPIDTVWMNKRVSQRVALKEMRDEVDQPLGTEPIQLAVCWREGSGFLSQAMAGNH